MADKSMQNILAEAFELKAVAYDTSVLGRKATRPMSTIFCEKARHWCDAIFGKRDQTSHYWCYELAKARRP